TAAPAAGVARGRRLFLGAVSPRSGGASCAACHSVREAPAAMHATLGNGLTHAFSRFQDAALSAVIERPCFPRVGTRLTADETFAVRAFLRHVDDNAPGSATPGAR